MNIECNVVRSFAECGAVWLLFFFSDRCITCEISLCKSQNQSAINFGVRYSCEPISDVNNYHSILLKRHAYLVDNKFLFTNNPNQPKNWADYWMLIFLWNMGISRSYGFFLFSFNHVSVVQHVCPPPGDSRRVFGTSLVFFTNFRLRLWENGSKSL